MIKFNHEKFIILVAPRKTHTHTHRIRKKKEEARLTEHTNQQL